MVHDASISADHPKSVWTRPVSLKFSKLATALGKGAIAGAFGNWPGVVGSGLEAVKALGLEGQGAGAIAWLLAERSLLQAMSDLLAPYQKDLTSEPNFRQLCEQLDLALEEGNLALSLDFFDRPKDLEVLGLVTEPYRRWLEIHGLKHTEAAAIAGRLPTHFVFALNEQWRSHPQEYEVLQKQLDTPFTKATEREREWLCYEAWLERWVDEPICNSEKFSLKQIYVPSRSYYIPEKENAETTDKQIRVVVDSEQELLRWIEQADRKDSIRLVCGSPGSGKSSFLKMFATRIVKEAPLKRRISTLFIPLYDLDASEGLEGLVKNYYAKTSFNELLPPNPINPIEVEHSRTCLLLILDGLDEVSMQGKVAAEAAQGLLEETRQKLNHLNRSERRVLALFSGREVVARNLPKRNWKSDRILYLLPYHVSNEERMQYEYRDENDLLDEDLRYEWREKYSNLVDLKDKGALEFLQQDHLDDITVQPLLNYLTTSRFINGDLDLCDNDLNPIYAQLLEQIYERGWEEESHPELNDISSTLFSRILEEIAVACWHHGEYTATIKQVEIRLQKDAAEELKETLEYSEISIRDRVIRILTAFYFKWSGIEDRNRPFEFAHKPFCDYLIARRIVSEVNLIHSRFNEFVDDSDSVWDERECLKHWIALCSDASINRNLLEFLRNEIKFQARKSNEALSRWQGTIATLISHILRRSLPMEELKTRSKFWLESKQARNSGEVLLAVLDACATETQEISEIQWESSPPELFGTWLAFLRGQRTLRKEESIALSCLRYLNLEGCSLVSTDLEGADFRGANLSGAELKNADLKNASFIDATLTKLEHKKEEPLLADLREARLENANFQGADLSEARLTQANLREACLKDTKLVAAELVKADLTSADLTRANLSSALLDQAILTNANLESAELHDAELIGAELTGANLCSANLFRVTLTETNLSNAELMDSYLKTADLSNANLNSANLSNADLTDAKFFKAKLRDANLNGAILLSTDLRNSEELLCKQLDGDSRPLLCNVALPSNLTNLDPDRDCGCLPQVISARYNVSLDEAQKIISKARKKSWD